MPKNRMPGLVPATLAACLLVFASFVPTPAAAANSNDGNDGWLGVVLMARETAKHEDRGDEHSSRELRIMEVMDDSPAEAAGLEDGDLIVAVDGRDIEQLGGFVDLVRDRAPGTMVELTIERDGVRQTKMVTLGERPAHMARAHKLARQLKFHGPGHRSFVFGGGGAKVRIGIGLQGLTDGLREHFGAPADEGVLVSEVFEDSPAQDAGLKAGDIVLAINGESVSSHAELVKGLKDLKPGDTARLQILRNRSQMMVDVTVEAKPGPLSMSFCCEGECAGDDCCGTGMHIWTGDDGQTIDLGDMKLGENFKLLDAEGLENLDIHLEGLGENIEARIKQALDGLQHNVYIAETDGDNDCLVRVEEMEGDGEHSTKDVWVECKSGDGPQVITLGGHGKQVQVKKLSPVVVDSPDDSF